MSTIKSRTFAHRDVCVLVYRDSPRLKAMPLEEKMIELQLKENKAITAAEKGFDGIQDADISAGEARNWCKKNAGKTASESNYVKKADFREHISDLLNADLANFSDGKVQKKMCECKEKEGTLPEKCAGCHYPCKQAADMISIQDPHEELRENEGKVIAFAPINWREAGMLAPEERATQKEENDVPGVYFAAAPKNYNVPRALGAQDVAIDIGSVHGTGYRGNREAGGEEMKQAGKGRIIKNVAGRVFQSVKSVFSYITGSNNKAGRV